MIVQEIPAQGRDDNELVILYANRQQREKKKLVHKKSQLMAGMTGKKFSYLQSVTNAF
jgi:hypothetical protein